MRKKEQDLINTKVFEEDPIEVNRSSFYPAPSNKNNALQNPSRMTFLEIENSTDQGEGAIGRQGPISDFHKLEDENAASDSEAVARQIPHMISGSDQFSVHKGHADFDQSPKIYDNLKASKWTWDKRKRATVKVIYLSVFAMLGCLLRIIMAQYFGLECQNPGSVGWLKASQPLCVTADGEARIEGGIIYADLPANLLGSFLMGLMQTTDALDLPKTFPIAWLRDSHPFQSDHVLHLAIRVGFCGSLTTFSSWNSEMVVMSFGEGPDGISLFFRAMLGYFIGVETALAAFVLGRNVAKYVHGRVNPAFEKEAHEEKRKRAEGVYINSHLSDYERQYLSGYDMDEHTIYIDADAAEFLARWKYSTDHNRRVSDRLLPLLTDIECQTLGAGEFIGKELELEGREAGWDMDALACWVDVKNDLYLGSTNSAAESTPFRLFTALLWICCLLGFLLFFIFTQNDDTAVSVTYRTMMYAVLFAPAGALLRWKLSSWNGSYKELVWFPIGTFTANLIACILSATMIGLDYRMEMYGYFGFWSLGTVRAAKIGFSGCLSTVSTFISEFHTFLNSSHPWKGYMYVTITLGLSFICGVVPYFLSSGGAVIEYYD